ncbi:HNH endonuclease [Kitasatospora sp. NPDC056731]|uniref:HNH endonuclease n=1 Tax=Kitasatospora sp. NPDC056731 TaxID=3155422 RepID=UPI00342B555C
MTLQKRSCEGCGRPALARGMCKTRYVAWRRRTPPAERSPITPETRFWSKVDRDGPIPIHLPRLGNCWIWIGATNYWGYGKLRVDKRDYIAHRWSYEMANGSIPAGFFVLHRCDHPGCVRPSHLRLGTARDNTQDMHGKGRAANLGPLGMANSHAKLTDEEVIAIRVRFEAGELISALALEHGVNRSTISQIVNGRRWKHLGGPTRKPGQLGRRPRKEAA